MPSRAVSPSAAPSTSAPRKGYTEPRIFTPPLRELTPETSLGFDVVDFAENDLKVTLHPYQRWLYIHALELLEDGNFRFRTIIVLIARQNGKTTWWKILVLYFMYVLGMKALSTAQDLDQAESTWEEVVDWVLEQDDDENYAHPELAEAARLPPVRTNGKKSFRLKTGEFYKAKAASRRAARGASVELVGLDELREHQNWDSWSAITHTTMARARSIVVGLSNAGDVTSVVLRYFRKLAHQALGDPDGLNAAEDPSLLLDGVEDIDGEDESLGLFEWSAAPGCSIRDWDGLAHANPALNHPNGVPERNIKAAMSEPEWSFRTEVMCQWSDGTLEGPFPSGTWEAGRWAPKFDGDTPPPIIAKVKACVDVSADHTRTHISFAGYVNGRQRVVVVASRAGSEWVAPWLKERLDVVEEIAAQGRGAPVSNLLDDWEAEGLPIVRWQGQDLTDSVAAFYNAVRNAEFEHLPQPVLDVAAATAATKPAGDGVWLWDRKKSAVDIAPLVAANGAWWLLNRVQEKPFVSVYEERALIVV